MSWERRGRRRYLYRARRIGGRVVKRYVGPKGGAWSELEAIVAALEEADRLERAAVLEEQREARRVIRAQVEQLTRLRRPLDGAAREAMRAELEALGLHQHHRGEWRRKRSSKMDVTTTTAPASEAGALTTCEAPKVPSAAPRPGAALRLWAAASHPDAKAQAAAQRRAEQLAEELAGPGASMAVRLLAERAALDRLALEVMEGSLIRCATTATPEATTKLNASLVDQLHRRYTGSLVSLERLRRMVPGVFVNVNLPVEGPVPAARSTVTASEAIDAAA